MLWRLLKQAPKFAIALAIIVASTALFFAWQFTQSLKRAADTRAPVVAEDRSKNAAKVEANHDRLILVDNDLYDIETGELIFKNWLNRGMPVKLFWEPETLTVTAQYERSFVRYAPDGTEKAALVQPHPFVISNEYKKVTYSKDKDIWQADVDWNALKFANERKVTTGQQFNDQSFAANVALLSEKALIVRNLNAEVRVNLGSGEYHPIKLPLTELAKRRSPDGQSVVGIQNGTFYRYDVNSDEAKAIQLGRLGINDYQWLDDNRCAFIAATKAVMMYNRQKHAISEIAALPYPCVKIGEPSPDGRFVFCVGGKNAALVDVERMTALPVKGGQGISWVSNDTFSFSREIADSTLRGTWLQRVGQDERQVSLEPYLVANSGRHIMVLPSGGIIVFATKQGLSKLRVDGMDAMEWVKLAKPPSRVLGIQNWKSEVSVRRSASSGGRRRCWRIRRYDIYKIYG